MEINTTPLEELLQETLEARVELTQTAKMVFDRRLSAGTGGNISCKYGRYILISGARTCLGSLTQEDVVLTDMEGKVLSGDNPSSELPIHLAAYRKRADIGAIIHTHSPYIQVYAVANMPIDENILPDIVKNFGKIPCEEYHPPGSEELAQHTAKYLTENNAVIMGNHGLLVVGKDLKQAFKFADTAEHYANVCYLINNSNMLKKPIPEDQVAALRAKR